MKLKYYMRGLGIGIVVTAIILSLSNYRNNEKVDKQPQNEEIVKDDTNFSLADLKDVSVSDNATSISGNDILNSRDDDVSGGDAVDSDEEDKLNIDTNSDSDSKLEQDDDLENVELSDSTNSELEDALSGKDDLVNSSTDSPIPSDTNIDSSDTIISIEDNESQDKVTEDLNSQEEVVIVIKSGSGSDTVSKAIANAGLVENSAKFDKFLCDNGYSKSIRVGTYTIKMGASYEEIARIITGRK